MKFKLNSTTRELEQYISNLHSEVSAFMTKKKHEKQSYLLELTAAVKKIEELSTFKSDTQIHI